MERTLVLIKPDGVRRNIVGEVISRIERKGLNLVAMASRDGITAVAGNANDMSAFDDESFELVMSNATLEHDRYFWLSVAGFAQLVVALPLAVLDRIGICMPFDAHALAGIIVLE